MKLQDKIRELRLLEAKSTKYWGVANDLDFYYIMNKDTEVGSVYEDILLACETRNALPELLDYIEEQDKKIELCEALIEVKDIIKKDTQKENEGLLKKIEKLEKVFEAAEKVYKKITISKAIDATEYTKVGSIIAKELIDVFTEVKQMNDD